MDLIIILVVLGGVMFEVESRWRAGKYRSSGDDECVKINSNDNLDNLQCIKGIPHTCDRTFHNQECNTDDPNYEFNSNTNKCYKMHNKRIYWVDAFKTCNSEGSYLVIINSNDEAKAVVDLVAKKSNDKYFSVGWHDRFELKYFVDITSKPLSESGYTRWARGEPRGSITNIFGLGLCGCMDRDALYYTASCSTLYSFICERDV